MRALFIHNSFPAQGKHLAAALARDPGNEVVFVTADPDGAIEGVKKRLFAPARSVSQGCHAYLRWTERAVLAGQAAYRVCHQLKQEGFVPDVVWAHAGWGPALYVKELYPDCRLTGYFEWYYRGQESDADFLDEVEPDDVLRLRTRNAPLLLEMAACDAAITPTRFQHAQFPAMAAERMTVLHDGIDTDFFAPDASSRFSLPDLPDDCQLVTYATRGMEPYRGFPQFMRALARLQARRPSLHAVIAAEDRVIYGRRLPNGESWGRRMLAELPELDLSRIHFTGHLPYESYRALLRRSDAHVYLTVPFVLSWSAVEAMSTGCLMIGSDTAPLREIIDPGVNGLLADFHDPGDLAARIEEGLDMESGASRRMRAAARATARARYSLKDLLPRQLALLRG